MAESEVALTRRALPVVSTLWTWAYAAFAIVGADTMWAVALGDRVLATWDPTPGLPFAAPMVDWPGPLALGGVVLSLAHGLAPWGLVALHLVLVWLTLALVEVPLIRRGVSTAEVAARVSLMAVGAAAAFAVVRLPSLSLVPFVVLAWLLRRDHRVGDRHVWWVAPIMALWANLHGGFVIGLAMVGAYAVGSAWERRRVRPLAVLAVAALATLATPVNVRILGYVRTVFDNEAAAQHSDLWARPDLAHPLDLAMIVAGVVLIVLLARRRPPAWEMLTVAGLVVGTALAARNGTWLLLFAGSALAMTPGEWESSPSRRSWGRTVPLMLLAVAVSLVPAVVLAAARGPVVEPPGARESGKLRELLGDRLVLVDEPLSETLAVSGLRVWMANPIDAFDRSLQRTYLDFLQGKGTTDVPTEVRVAVVKDGSVSAKSVVGQEGWRTTSTIGPYLVLERTP